VARDIAGEGFKRWEELIADGLRREGIKPANARQMATMIVSSLEGAVVLSRAQRSIQPLEQVLRQVERFIEASTPRGVRKPRRAT
jgi:hypothetical protein